MAEPTTGSGSARQRVAEALQVAAQRFPHLPPTTLDVAALDRRDARLALAIHRTVLQRWITLEYLLDRHLRQPMHQLEPALRAVLLSAAAQLLFMDRLPTHAVVNESVNLAGRMVRPGAAGLVNAVLRRLAEQVVQAAHDQPWVAAGDRLPLDDGCVVLRDPCLPDPGNFVEHLAVATSHPAELVYVSIQAMGEEQASGPERQHPMGRNVVVNLVYDRRREGIAAIYGTARDFRPFVDAFREAFGLDEEQPIDPASGQKEDESK